MGIPNPETITISGISRQTYHFNVYPRYSSWNSVSGVYVLLKKGLTGTYDTVYVGETADLKSRFASHHKASCFDASGWTHLAFLGCADVMRRLQIEADILKRYHFPCND